MTEPSERDRAKRLVLAYWASDDFSKLEDIAHKELEAAREEGQREERSRCVALCDQERLSLKNGAAINACREIKRAIKCGKAGKNE